MTNRLDAPSARLKHARSLRFATASEAARYLGLATPTYLAHENGTRNVTWEQAEYYARKFNVRTDWLLAGRGEMSDDPEAGNLTPLNSSVARSSSRYTNVNPLFALLQVGYSPDGLLRPLASAREAGPAQLPSLDLSMGYIPEIVAADPTAADARREIRLPGGPVGNCKLVVDDFTRLPRDMLNLDYAVSVRFGDNELIEGSSSVDRMIINPLDRAPGRSGFYMAYKNGRLRPLIAGQMQVSSDGPPILVTSTSRYEVGEQWPEVKEHEFLSTVVGKAERVLMSLGREIEFTFTKAIFESQQRALSAMPMMPVLAPAAPGGFGGGTTSEQRLGVPREPVRYFSPW
jgi:DNA-binding XRE family transcriptional regulator